MKDTSSPDQDPGGPVPLAHKNLSDISGIGLGTHFRSSQMRGSQVHDPSGYLRGPLGLPGTNLHHPFHLAALTSPVYPPSLLGPNFPPAALMASLSTRSDPVNRGRPSIPPPLIPSSRGSTLTNLHATLAAGDASHHADLFAILKDSARQQELLLALSKLSPSTASSSPSSSTSSSRSSVTASSFHRPHYRTSPSSPPQRTPHEVPSPKRQPERASSLSPSSYLTPRSLNGSPSASFAAGSSTPSITGAVTPTFSPRMFALSNFSTPDNLSPTSPPTGDESGATNTTRPPSAGATPVSRRSSSTPRPDRVFTCRTCNRSFGYKHVLQNHERTHTGEKPFECRECHKRFTRDHHLKTHMRLHTGEKPYHCTHCDRQFVQVANLRRHLRVHTGERPYSCDACPSRFSDSNQLKAHLLIHKGEKPYGCHGCRASFRRRHHLIQHKCSGDSDPLGPSSYLPGEEAVGYAGDPMFSNEDIDEDELTDEGTASPMGTPLPSTMTVLADEEGPLLPEKRRGRKSKEPRRLVANPSPSLHSPSTRNAIARPNLPPTPLPEQTEPEDLSMSGPRRREASHTYRANIALATSATACSPYPLQYPSSLKNHSGGKEEDKIIVDTYSTKEVKPIGFNS